MSCRALCWRRAVRGLQHGGGEQRVLPEEHRGRPAGPERRVRPRHPSRARACTCTPTLAFLHYTLLIGYWLSGLLAAQLRLGQPARLRGRRHDGRCDRFGRGYQSARFLLHIQIYCTRTSCERSFSMSHSRVHVRCFEHMRTCLLCSCSCSSRAFRSRRSRRR